MKRGVSLLLVIMMLFVAVACTKSEDIGTEHDTEAVKESETMKETEGEVSEEKETQTQRENSSVQNAVWTLTPPEDRRIDLYLIAGQSNAAGHSKVSNTKTLFDVAPGLKNGGYSHVLYAGNARSNDGDTLIHNERSWVRTTLGLGKKGAGVSYMGPEAGMAAALSEYYNEESGKMAGLIKYAHGGTSLFDVRTGMCAFGNWVSPSAAREQGLSYSDADITGGLYRGLLAEVRKQVDVLKDAGFEEIRLCGLYWMQGEMDTARKDDYPHAFELFVLDLRRDLGAMMVELTGNDGGGGNLPVIVGSVSVTCGSAAETDVAKKRAFVEMQSGLAQRVSNVFFLDHSNYAITRWDSNTNKSVAVGSDMYHWNQEDALNIGMNVGRLILSEQLHGRDAS